MSTRIDRKDTHAKSLIVFFNKFTNFKLVNFKILKSFLINEFKT